MTSYSGLFNDNGGSYSLIQDKIPSRNLARILARKNGFRKLRELFDTLIGAASGGTAAASFARIENDADNGGVRTIETVSVINRASTADDITALKEIVVNVKRYPDPYVVDASGNGGPAFNVNG